MIWIAVGVGIVIIGAVALWWLLITTEGVYLGRRTVIWLYDMYASRYDNIKQYNPHHEDHYLARPILERLPHIHAPLVLDVATGTGRLPLALLEQSTFQGRVIGLDLSRKMLTVAAEKLAPFGGRVSLLHHSAETLPFPDDTFDLVTCLEALEFMMNPVGVLHELVRVLRPGGLLALTNRQGFDARLMPGQVFSHDKLERLLRKDLELLHVTVQRWQVDYRMVWAIKPGLSQPAGALTLEEVWRCPQCGTVDMIPVEGGWRCLTCEGFVATGADGVIEAHRIAGAFSSSVRP
jgi:ubiquinone/menaquinone biosynthesis C-methylase UbiE